MRKMRLIFMVIVTALIGIGALSPVRAELVAHYSFDDGTATDASGNGLHGEVIGPVQFVYDEERGGTVIELDGSSSYINLGNPPELDFSVGGNATVAVWINMAVQKNHNQVFAQGEWRDGIGISIKGDTNPPNQVWTGGRDTILSGEAVPVGEWTHVAVTVSDYYDVSIYINGELVATGVRSDALGSPAAPGSGIGREWRSASPGDLRWVFAGRIDDVQLYNVALSESDIVNVMTGTGVTDIDPPNGAIRVPVDQILSWNPPEIEDPNLVITGYDVYFDPNQVKVADGDITVKVATNQPETTYDPGVLDYVRTYYWRVDVVGQYDDLPDPNIFPGAVFSFTTMSLSPEIIGQPVDQVRGPANGKPDAALTVEALNATNYQWYKDDAPIDGATEPTLTIIGVQPDDEGQYYCVVSNIDSPDEIQSNTVWVEYARLTSQWDFEQTLTDTIGGYDGVYYDPNESPGVFATDSRAGDYAVQFGGEDDWVELPATALPKAGTEMTFAFWAKNFTPSVGTVTLYASADESPDDRLINIHTPWSNNNAYLDVSNPDEGGSYDRVSAGNAVNGAVEPYWIHWVFTKDAETGVMRIYRNGQRVGQSTGQMRRYYGADRFFLGANRDADEQFGQFFNGLIDDLRIYNYALGEVETAYLYYDMAGEKVCVDPADPVLALYDFNGNCKIDLGDIAELASHWLTCQRVPDCIERP
ncbi:MAG TPA: hypothetical protein ENN97_09900 [Phycisphaerales bacterium]|nr:hypothetical protein [Phycisphaerales bacterium]